MSEDRSRFKIKKEGFEIEYEGKSSEVSERYKEAFEWIKTVTTIPPERKPLKEEKKAKEKKSGEKKERRGGVRTAVVSPEIGRLTEEGWMDDFKTIDAVMEELETRAVPGVSRVAVANALRRRVGRTLARIKTKEGKWIYRRIREE